MKQISILKGNDGRLANQLWLYVNIYVYSLENNLKIKNPSFYRYNHYFNIKPNNLFEKIFIKKHNRITNRVLIIIYNIFVKLQLFLIPKEQIFIDNYKQKSLEKNSNLDNRIQELIKKNKDIYIIGWPFYNPTLIKKYHLEIKIFFKPKNIYTQKIDNLIAEFRKKYEKIIGVHIRQGDYKIFKNGEFLINQESFEKEMLSLQKNTSEKILFIICSDEHVKMQNKSIDTYFQSDSEIVDLYTLSLCDMIVGSDSTFGRWAAMYGGIPFQLIKTKKTEIPYYIEILS
jgi:hypothetical protein